MAINTHNKYPLADGQRQSICGDVGGKAAAAATRAPIAMHTGSCWERQVHVVEASDDAGHDAAAAAGAISRIADKLHRSISREVRLRFRVGKG